MPSSPEAIYSWAGVVLVNVGFILLISWGAQTWWPLGFALCGGYAALLFGLANYIARQKDDRDRGAEPEAQEDEQAIEQGSDDHELNDTEVVEQIIFEANSMQEGHTILRLSLLYGLAIASMGVTGFFVPANVFAYCHNDSQANVARYEWKTNFSSLPDSVQAWASKTNESPYCAASFAYLSETRTTLFRGEIAGATHLWSTSHDSPPQLHSDYQFPGHFMIVSNQTVCFVDDIDLSIISCANKTGIYQTRSLPEGILNPRSFVVFDEVLWFKTLPRQALEVGNIVYSLAKESMDFNLYSFKERIDDQRNDDGEHCDEYKILRMQAILTIILTSLPTTLTSIWIWKQRRVPFMAVTTYVGLSITYVCLFLIMNPRIESDRPFLWWFSASGIVWLLGLTCINVSSSSNETNRTACQWGLVIGGLAYLQTGALIHMEQDRFNEWVQLNVIVFMPLLFFGAANKHGFLQFLAAVGFLIDAGRLAQYIGDHVGDGTRVALQFLVFSISGILISVLGLAVNRYQDSVHRFAIVVVHDGTSIVTGRSSHRNSNTGEEAEEITVPDTAPLLAET